MSKFIIIEEAGLILNAESVRSISTFIRTGAGTVKQFGFTIAHDIGSAEIVFDSKKERDDIFKVLRVEFDRLNGVKALPSQKPDWVK